MSATMSAQDFVNKWRGVTGTERATSQSHFIDVCALVGHPTPTEKDPLGTTFAFEAGVEKVSGGQGFADVWKKDYFAWEYKGPHGNLEKAYQQLLQYHEALENPPLLVVSDMQTIVIHTKFTYTAKKDYTLTLDDLLKPASLDILRNVFFNPEALRAAQTTAEVTQEAASEFARLAERLNKMGAEPHQTAHFLIRLLFCLFAEDVDKRLLPDKLLTRLIEQAHNRTATMFTAQLRQLFGVMATGGWFGADEVAHFDGGLFDDDQALDLDSDSMEILRRVCQLDWSNIEPSIIGTLFERGLDPTKRSQLGAQYTGKDDILLIVEPVLMAPLRRKWADVKAKARALAKRAGETKVAGTRTKLQNELAALLRSFADEIAHISVLDAACGGGNFLYISLKLLHDLEKEVITLARELNVGGFFPSVSPDQVHGIEIHSFAHELAQTTVWIGHIQWLRDNGFGVPSAPILKPLHTIIEMDSIMAYDANGIPVEPEWPAVDVIVGNPPFLGDKKMRAELGDKYVDDLRRLFADRIPGQSDLVCYWFEKARAMIAAGKAKRAGLLATQGIRGGANRTVLERIKETGDIFMAWSDREWVLDGAAVNISVIGFDDGSETSRTLDGQSVIAINPNLTTSSNLTTTLPLKENAGISFVGPSPHGSFDIDSRTAELMLQSRGNPNGKPNSDVVRRVVSAVDLVQRPRKLWTIDFEVMPLSEAAKYEMPFEHVKKHVYPERKDNRRAAYAEKWWQYAEARPGLRQAIMNYHRHIATPRIAKHRIFAWIDSGVLANDGTIVFARDDDYFFGVLQSKIHEMWALHKGTALEDRPRYTPTSTFETFPLPWPPSKEPKGDARVKAIAEAAKALVEQRDAWLNPPGTSEAELKKRTLTNLYNERPTWLELAHNKLDDAVLHAYGWPHELSDEEILARLLKLNLERASKG
jgi:type II restriction/modification system DNA methylase subunit YeeA